MNLIPEIKDLLSIFPAIILSAGGILFLVIQFIFHHNDHKIIRFLTGMVLIGTLWSLCTTSFINPGYGSYFKGQIRLSNLTFWLNTIYAITAFLTILASPRVLRQHDVSFPEFYPLLLFSVVGMFFMTTGSDLIVIFIGLEILSISLYIMIGMARNSISCLEATMKYFLLGAFTSGFMLMGIAFMYGASGSTLLKDALYPMFAGSEPYALYSKLGFGLFIVGVSFKVALVPFHSWTPDVYEGALTTITGYMASGPKAAAMGLMLVLFQYFPTYNYDLTWNIMLGVIAAISMTLGNVLALRQDNIKRVLAYSSISHAGYVVAGIVCGAKWTVVYYLIMYSFMNIAGFSILAFLENGKLVITYNSLKHLVKTNPFTSFALLVVFFSLGGIPPLGGFWTKLFLFQEIAKSNDPINRILLILGVINSAIAIYYYLRVTVSAFMSEDSGEVANSEPIQTSWGISVAATMSIFFIMFGWIVFYPSSL
ncbi:MAG: NADH-quinone oxidoreductase subunit N [Leptospiraceae bacterium]|nr:NADH-quinone oxidoreductase subunit N [Leptospiraceae bacterium]